MSGPTLSYSTPTHPQRTSRTHDRDQTQVQVGSVVFGGPGVVVIAGPCSVESQSQLMTVGQHLKALGIPGLRGAIFKPRTSPYTFQGLGEAGIPVLEAVRQQLGLTLFTEVMNEEQIQQVAPFVDCFQVGSRNMQNTSLLRALGRQQKPVLLKRGMAATLEEFLMAAEYILSEGNDQIILCERGIRSFDPATRNVLDLGAVALLKQESHLPVIVDPSHGTGRRELVAPMAAAAIAAGADGLMIEAHPSPEASVSDALQAISLEELTQLLGQLTPLCQAMGRHLLLQ